MRLFSLYLLTVLIWGSTWYAITFQIGNVPTLVTITYRFLIAAACMLGLGFIKYRQLPRYSLKEHGFVALQGLLMFCLNYIGFMNASKHVVSGLVAVGSSVIIIFNTILSALIFRSRTTFGMILGSICGICGILAVFWDDLFLVGLCNNAILGLTFSVLASLSSSVGNMISAYLQRQQKRVIENCALGMTYGTLWSGLFAILFGHEFTLDLSMPYILSSLYLSLLGSAIAFWCYLTVLRDIGPAKAAYALVSTPIIALVISGIFEGFTWTNNSFIGIGLVILGNVLILIKRA